MIANLRRFGLLALFFVFFTNLFSVTILMVGGRIHWMIAILSIISAVILTYFVIAPMDDNKLDFLICVVLFILVLFWTISYFGEIFSNDWDGNFYHKMAVGLLKNGWNPILESAADFTKIYFGNNVPSHDIWIDHYGKASWLYAAVMYAITGNIEVGKTYHFWGIFALFFLLLAYLLEKEVSDAKAIIISLLVALNPVSLVQGMTYYVDGFLFSYLFILVLGCIQFLEQKNKVLSWVIIFGTMPVLANIKFTGLLYGGIFCIVFYIFNVVIQFINNKSNWRQKALHTLIPFSILALVSVLWFGYPTYVKNFVDHGSIVYPLSGSDVDIMTNNSPIGFDNKNIFFKLFYGLFCEVDNLTQANIDNPLPILKIPFTVSHEELELLDVVDLRCSGFGIFFGGILVISLIVIVAYLFSAKNDKQKRIFVGVLFGVILALSFTISESWWARYAPHIYMIPCIAIAILLSMNLKKWCKFFCYGLITLLLINNLVFIHRSYERVIDSYYANMTLDSLSGKTIDIGSLGAFSGYLFNLEDKNIIYNVVDEGLDEVDGSLYGGIKWKEK